MLFNSGPTPYDVRFPLFGIPVRISPIFWVAALLLGGNQRPETAAIWVGAVLVSILVHELGHAVLQQFFGGRSEIVLYAFGGYASAVGVRDSWWRHILIALAGPAAGFVLAGAAYGVVALFGSPRNELAYRVVEYLKFINVWWGVLNLAPIWPLDGGHVARELLTRFLPPTKGIVASLYLSMLCGAALAAWAFYATESLWNTALFGMLAYQSYETLQQYRRSRGGW